MSPLLACMTSLISRSLTLPKQAIKSPPRPPKTLLVHQRLKSRVSEFISTSSDFLVQEEEIKPGVDEKPEGVVSGVEGLGNDEENGIECLGKRKPEGTIDDPFVVY